jgi:hypothetical protein
LALLLVAAMTAIGLGAAPMIGYDPAFGWMRWHGLLQGAPFDAVLGPDPADIARDSVSAASWWSPGQYLVPGLLTLTGLRIGTAVVLVAGLSNAAALLGWIAVARRFTLGPRVALFATVLIASFRYSSSPYGLYSGGEILLQGATPWLVLAAWQVPRATLTAAAALALAAVLGGFIAKLNGLIVVASALAAAGVLVLFEMRRMTRGLIGGALGAALAVLVIYIFWFAAKPVTHFGGGGAGFDSVRLLFALSAPWTAALSWQDFMVWATQTPGRIVLDSEAPLVQIGLLPLAAVLAAMLLSYRKAPAPERMLRRFTLLMLVTFTVMMLVLYLSDAPIPLEERHFRPMSIMLLLCLLAMALRPGLKRWRGTPLLVLFGAMALYGLTSFGARTMQARQQTVDEYSGTLQPNADAQSLAALRRAFAMEGRDALFYLGAPELSVTLPHDARTIVEAPALMSEAAIAATPYRGRVKGQVHVIVSNTLPTTKTEAILESFTDYDMTKWQASRFASATLYSQ